MLPLLTWRQSCDATVYQKIATPDWFKQEEYVIPFLLDSYKVLIYNGVNDWICNHAGNYKWVTEMAWNGQAAFNTAPRLPWTSADYQLVKGYQQQAGNLQFVWVVNAGHMVPRAIWVLVILVLPSYHFFFLQMTNQSARWSCSSHLSSAPLSPFKTSRPCASKLHPCFRAARPASARNCFD